MIRVAHILWRADFGGIERLVLDLTTEQAGDPEIEVSILFGNAVGQFMPAFERTGARLDSVELNTGYDVSPRKLAHARQILRRADVIHAHTFVVPLALSMLWSRRPVVFTEHGNFGFGRKRTGSDIVKQPLVRAFMNRCVGHLTFNSEYTARMWAERGGLNGVQRSVVPNGIYFGDAGPAAVVPAPDLARWAQNSFVVGTSSRFAEVKRIDRLIDAFGRFHPGHGAKLLLVGDGPLRSSFERKVSEMGISDRTLFTGFRLDVRACQATMDVCVFPSIAESFGLVCVETLALGKPTIVFHDGGGMADIVRPLCAEDVVEDVAHLNQRLAFYSDTPKARESGSECRRAYARRYDIRNTAARFKQVYQSLVQTSP